jgi:DNA-binding GntR family transcriptional regulator
VRFHQAIAKAAGNNVMSGVMDTVALLLYQLRRETIKRASDFEEAIDWHQKIFEAIKKRDAKRAKEMLTGHLRAALAGWARDHKGDVAKAKSK